MKIAGRWPADCLQVRASSLSPGGRRAGDEGMSHPA